MLPMVSAVRIASGATVRSTSRVGARESGRGLRVARRARFLKHRGAVRPLARLGSRADCACAVTATSTMAGDEEKMAHGREFCHIK